jgi:mannose-6-phosphate isomerase-like protein (cupin superfamily)
MKAFTLGFAVLQMVTAPALAQVVNNDPEPTCKMCQGSYIPSEEIQAYTKKAVTERRIDQQVRDIDIGKSNVAVGVEHRSKLDKPGPQAVAEHDLVSEVYYVLDGSAVLELGPNLVNKKRRSADEETVRLFNGPGNNADAILDGVSYNLKPGDVVVIPAGTGHLFEHIDDHIDYIMVRVDPDKITPLRDDKASRAYLGDYLKR